MSKGLVRSYVLLFSMVAVAAPVVPRPAPPEPARSGAEDFSSVDCAALYAKGLAKQVNMRAGLLRAHCGDPSAAGQALRYAAPSLGGVIDLPPSVRALAIGGSDVNVITGGETYPHVTQSEAMVWGEGNTVVVNYNDSRLAPSSYSGISYSTDGGTTFTRILPGPFNSAHGTNYGDPIVVYNKKLSKWFAGDLATGCGGQGIGLWTSTDGVT